MLIKTYIPLNSKSVLSHNVRKRRRHEIDYGGSLQFQREEQSMYIQSRVSFKEGQREFSDLDKGREKRFYNRKTDRAVFCVTL